jgi:hypothetical protein
LQHENYAREISGIMEIANFWPSTADIYFEGEFLTKARLVGNAYEANYPSYMRLKLLELQRENRLWREEACRRTETRTAEGDLVGIDISDLRFELTIAPPGTDWTAPWLPA